MRVTHKLQKLIHVSIFGCIFSHNLFFKVKQDSHTCLEAKTRLSLKKKTTTWILSFLNFTDLFIFQKVIYFFEMLSWFKTKQKIDFNWRWKKKAEKFICFVHIYIYLSIHLSNWMQSGFKILKGIKMIIQTKSRLWIMNRPYLYNHYVDYI